MGRYYLQIFALGAELVIAEQSLLPVHTSILGKAFTSQEIVYVPELQGSEAAEAEMLRRAGMRSAVVCPLVCGGQSLGTINMAHPAPDYFTTEDGFLFRSVADLIASFASVHQLAEDEHVRAQTDTLTNCLNRGAILAHYTKCYEQDLSAPSLLYLDVDGFKAINDRHGHLVGDEVLRVLSKRIRGVINDSDPLGRLGGDEFLVVVRHDQDGSLAKAIAERIADSCTLPFSVGSNRLEVDISIGVASADELELSAVELLHDADQAMYVAKGSARPIVVADRTTRATSARIAAVDRDLDAGMAHGAITYAFQPVREIGSRAVVGAEALIRWEHPDHGTIPASLLIDRLHATGRTEALTRWSLETVVEQWSQVRNRLAADRAPDGPLPVSLNLTPRQLAWEGYADFHMRTLRNAGFAPEDVVIEVVETSEVRPGDAAEATLRRLSDNGISIALDDFGTGHSTLGYFTMFRVHAIKFDRSLVGVMHDSDVATRILSGLASMASDLGVISLAEGVETENQVELCEAANIVLGQGWHLGRPVPLEAFIDLVQDGPVERSPLTEEHRRPLTSRR